MGQIGQLNLGIGVFIKNKVFSGSIIIILKRAMTSMEPAPLIIQRGQQNTIVKNVADMKRNGIDLVLKTKNIDQKFNGYYFTLQSRVK